MDGFGWRETSAESRRTRSISSSLARRLQNSEDEVARLARLNDKKDSAIRVLLVMKSVMLRKLGAQKAAGLFDASPGLHSASGVPRSRRERASSRYRPFVDSGASTSYSPSGYYRDFPRTPSSSPTLRRYQFGWQPDVSNGATSDGRSSLVGQLSLDMVRYQKELSEVFQDEIVAHHKVERDVEVVSNEANGVDILNSLRGQRHGRRRWRCSGVSSTG